MFTKTPASLVNWDYGKGYAGRAEVRKVGSGRGIGIHRPEALGLKY
jgi:hypothetical protein